MELRRSDGTRWFRMTRALALDAVSLTAALPDDLDGPLAVAFHLPGDAETLRCRGRAAEERVGSGADERAERRLVQLELGEAERARIASYLQERLGLTT